MEALQSATRNPARFLNELNAQGTVERGKLANLLLLDANPVEDIHNSQKIRAVMLGGKYLPKETLEKMLADVAAAAGR